MSEAVKRALAIVAAVVMVAVAIVVRSSIDSSGNTAPSSSGPATVVCVTELANQCRALTGGTIRIEEASVTAKAIAAGTANIDAWVTLDPWPAIVNQLARREVTGAPARVAQTDLVIAMVQERAARLMRTQECGGAVTWKCLGDDIGREWTDVGGQAEWGTVRAGIPATTSAEGLLALGHAASGYFGTSSFATNDFDDAFLVWKSKVTATPAPYTTFIQQFPAAFSAVGATRAEAVTGSGARPVTIVDAAPPARAVVVITPLPGRHVPGFTSGLKDRLREAGWSTDGLDNPTGLPDAGVLLALSGLTG